MAVRITQSDLKRCMDFRTYRKRTLTKARRMKGAFTVATYEGDLRCLDGYLAVDSRGYPYPIDKAEFEAIYEEVDGSHSENADAGEDHPGDTH